MKRQQLDRRVRAKVIERDGHRCTYCGVEVVEGVPGMRMLTVDHRVPRSRAGTDDLDNLVVACFSCNCRKHARDVDEFIASRHDCSEDCPEIDWLVGVPEAAHILGISRARADELSRQSGFPAPYSVLEVSGRRIWLTTDIREWGAERSA